MVSQAAARAALLAEAQAACAAATEAATVVAAAVAEMWGASCRECQRWRGKLSPRSSCESPILESATHRIRRRPT